MKLVEDMLDSVNVCYNYIPCMSQVGLFLFLYNYIGMK